MASGRTAGWWNCLLGWNWRVAHSGPRVGRVASNQEQPVEGASEPTSQSESAHARARSRIRRRSRVPLTRDSADPMDTEEVSPELMALMATLAKSNMSHDELDKLEAEEAAKAAASEASPEPPLAALQDPPDQQPPAEQHAEKSPGSDEQTAGNAEPEPPTGPAPTPAEPAAPAPEAPTPEAPTPEAPAPEAPAPEAPAPEAPAPEAPAPHSAPPPPRKSLLGKSNSVKVGVFSEKLSADAGNKAALQGAHAEIQKEAIQEEIASNPDAASDPAVAEKLAESQKAIDAAEEYREARRNLEAVRETSKQESVLAVEAAVAPVAVHLRADPDGNIDVLASDRLTREVLYETPRVDEPVAVAKSADEERPEGSDANVPADQRCADQVPSPDEKVNADQRGADQVPSPDAKVPADQRGADQVPSLDAKVPADQRGVDQVPSPSPPAKVIAGPPPVESASDALARAREGEVAAVDEVFAFLDTDGDGSVTVRELRDGVLAEPVLGRVLGLSAGRLAEDEVEAMFSRWDADGDRRLDRQEFGDIFGDAVIVAKAREDQAAARAAAEAAARRGQSRQSPVAEEVRELREELARLRQEMASAVAAAGASRRDGGARGATPSGFDAGYQSGGSGAGVSVGGSGRSPGSRTDEGRRWHSPSYQSYLDSPAFRSRLAEGSSSRDGADRFKPRIVNGYWREPLNMTPLRPAEKLAKVKDVVDEPEPIAGYKDRWRDGLRNGDIERFAPGKQTRRASGGGGSGATSASKSPSTSTRTIASKLGASSAEEALKEIESTAPGTYLGRRMFSRGFQRMYLSPPGLEPKRDASPTVDPPGVKTSAAELVGVVGLSGSRHKEDLRHKGSMQPLSFHRNVLGDKATTHTSTAPDEYSKYPRAKRKNKVWVA